MSYDTNVIVQFLTGSGDDIITTGTARLATKLGVAADHVVTVNFCGAHPFGMQPDTRQALRTALAFLTAGSRLYLRGHGDWKAATLGGWSAREVAGALILCGLSLSPSIISVTGCQCGRAVAPGAEGGSFSSFAERSRAQALLLERSTHSFAGLLHFRLCRRGITSPVYGRIYTVTIVGNDDEWYSPGQKITATPSGEEKHHRLRSKILFTWKNDAQVREWAY